LNVCLIDGSGRLFLKYTSDDAKLPDWRSKRLGLKISERVKGLRVASTPPNRLWLLGGRLW
jgi:hypothetical protein